MTEPAQQPQTPSAPPPPDADRDKKQEPDERRAPGFPGEASPGRVPPPRDGIDQTHDSVTGEVLDAPRKTFASFIIEQRNGALHAEASDVLAALVKAVQDHSKPGSVQITVHVKPGSKGTNTLVVSDEVKVKAPQGDRPAALFFPDEHGNLHRSDPRQQELPLRRVEVGPGAPLRRPGGDQR